MVLSKCEMIITCSNWPIPQPPPYSHCQTDTLAYVPLSHLIHPEDDECQNDGTILGWRVCMCMCEREWGERRDGCFISASYTLGLLQFVWNTQDTKCKA